MTALRDSLTDEELAAQAEAGDSYGGRWSQQEQLTATLVDVARQQLHAFYLANSNGKGKKPTPPEPIPRPGAKPTRKKTAAPSQRATETLFRLINGGAA